MPQETELHIPFPEGMNPDVAGAKQRCMDWFRGCGMLTTNEAVERYLSTDVAGLGANWYPEATGEILDALVCSLVFLEFVDDQVDGPIAIQPAIVSSLMNDLIHVMDPHPPARNFPDSLLVNAFIQLWPRLTHGMSAAWSMRLRESWTNFFNAFIEETQNRYKAIIPTVEDYMSNRRESGYMRVAINLLEKALSFEISPAVLATPQLCEMIEITIDVPDIVNDIQSVEKEEKRGDIHNMVMVLQQEHGCSREKALEMSAEMISGWSKRFQVLMAEIPTLCQSLKLSGQATVELQQYITGLGVLMRTSYEWGRKTKRYSTAYLIPAGQPGFVESYL